MVYYVVVDTKKYTTNKWDAVVACSEDKRIASHYVMDLNDISDDRYKLYKCKEKQIKKIHDWADLELLRVGNNYVPAKYADDVKDELYRATFDNILARDVIMKLLETKSLSNKDRKTLEKAVEIFEDLIDEDESSVVDIQTLIQLQEMRNESLYTGMYIDYMNYNPDEEVPFL